MFDLVNIGTNNNYVRVDEDNIVPSYTTGAAGTRPKDVYLLIDGQGETEIDRDYLDYLVSEDAVVYDGLDRDTYNNKEYRYILK